MRTLWLAAVVVAGPIAAQEPAPSVGLSFGVDTTAADVGAIVPMVRAYLQHPGCESDRWSRRDPIDRRYGDLTCTLVRQGFPATILGVVGTTPGDTTYVVKILYAKAESTGVYPLALERLYAVRERGAWALSNALPRQTRGWEQHRAGRITYWYQPGQRVHPEAVARAGRFIDSLATLFAIQPPDSLRYYVTASAEDYQRILGLDFFPLPSGPTSGLGGQALPAGIVLSGDPVLGDGYLHELVHATLGAAKSHSQLVNEGFATWFAGSKGRDRDQMVVLLRQYQRAHPAAHLSDLVPYSGSGPGEADALYATGALFVGGVYQHRGIAGLRALFAAPVDSSGVLGLMRAQLPEYAGDLERWWRDTVQKP